MPLTLAPAQSQPSLANLAEGKIVSGFKALAVYLNDADRSIGARFVHAKSGFTLDLLEIESVPQAFVWVNTYPSSNMGEPHTQEHLLLSKGNKGRAVASSEQLTALAGTSAFTLQWRTCYGFHTPAGVDVFLRQVEQRLDALLHPDYTDEEMRREVRNFGVAENSRDKSLRLEEQGTIYNEMVAFVDRPQYRLYRMTDVMAYGPEHPLAFESGGTPEGLGALQPDDIRKFHRANYHLANMGMIVSLPKPLPLASTLAAMNAILERVQPERPNSPIATEKDLPPPRPAPAGEIRILDYPDRNAQRSGSVALIWPAERRLDPMERVLIDLFAESFASHSTSSLYERLIDRRTREADVGATDVLASVSTELGQPVSITFENLPVARMNERDLTDLRARVMDELNRTAAWKDGSGELADFRARVESALKRRRRSLSKFVNSPPRFAFRRTNGGESWMRQLDVLSQCSGFRKSVTLKPEMAALEKLLASDRNIWSEYLKKWKLAGVQPWIVAVKPNPELIKREREDKEARVRAESARLMEKYGVSDEQEAIRRYRAEYDAGTAVTDRAAAAVVLPDFMDNPPMTIDDQLNWNFTKLARGVPLVASTFDSMTGATAGLALRLDGVPDDRLLYLTLLPQLLTSVGVIEDGRPVSYQEMNRRVRSDILGLDASFSSNASTGRVELTLQASGSDISEVQKALDWMRLALFHPDLRPENLPRIRDVVDQALARLRRTTQGAEEFWTQGPATAWQAQDNPLIVLANSFMTQTHNAHRLRWMLKDASDEARAGATRLLDSLAATRGTREELNTLLAELKAGNSARLEGLVESARILAADAARDLEIILSDIPDASLASDWSYLCRAMSRDLNIGPVKALLAIDEVRQSLLKTGTARMFLISSASARAELVGGIESLLAGLHEAPLTKARRSGVRLIADRLRRRDSGAVNPVYVGLLNENSQGGVFLHSAPLAGYHDTDREKLLQYLSTNLYSGAAAHGIYMKTWAAGLAYSNGLRALPGSGRLIYYADHTPDLPQTMKFVVAQLKSGPPPDHSLVEYALAGSFAATRSASLYEVRGEAMAADLADGLTPEIVARFHQKLLELRHEPGLPAELHRRMNLAYGKVLPGLSVKTSMVPGGAFMVIGPEKQFAAWQDYLQTVEGPHAKLYRLYPRDFWMIAE